MEKQIHTEEKLFIAPSQNVDIIDVLEEDHKPLKKLLKTLKDGDATHAQRKEAFEEFTPLLTAHAKSEEKTLYVRMKEVKELRMEGLEGDIEHEIADSLAKAAKSVDETDLFDANVKVLAELVEHHIEEEEEEVFPHFKKESDAAERGELAREYLELKATFHDGGEATEEPAQLLGDQDQVRH